MRNGKLIDILSVVLALGIGGDLIYTNVRLAKLERIAAALPIEQQTLAVGTHFLPTKAINFAGQKVNVPTGQKKFIFYFSAHCGACTKEMPEWSQAARALGKENVLFLTVDELPAAKQEVGNYLASNGLNGFSSLSIDKGVMKTYGMFSVPQTLLVASDGTVRKLWRGVAKHQDFLNAWKL